MSDLAPRLSRAMRAAARRLADGPALARPAAHPDCERFVAADGQGIDLATLRGLSRRGLARQLLRPSRFVLSEAGRRLAAQLRPPLAA